jgi:hypothetical protein
VDVRLRELIIWAKLEFRFLVMVNLWLVGAAAVADKGGVAEISSQRTDPRQNTQKEKEKFVNKA